MDQSIRLRRPDEAEPVDEVVVPMRSAMNFVFITSSAEAIRADLGDRRFVVVDLANQE